MSIADKLTAIAENEQRVYNAGKQAEYDRFWDIYQSNGNRSSYSYAFAGVAWNDDTFNPKYPIGNGTELSINYCFYYATSITKIPTIKAVEWAYFNGTFTQCTSLVDVTFDGVIGRNISFSNSPLLSHASIMGVFEHLKDYSAGTATYTVTLGTTNLAKLSDAEKAIATQKGWTLA